MTTSLDTFLLLQLGVLSPQSGVLDLVLADGHGGHDDGAAPGPGGVGEEVVVLPLVLDCLLPLHPANVKTNMSLPPHPLPV